MRLKVKLLFITVSLFIAFLIVLIYFTQNENRKSDFLDKSYSEQKRQSVEESQKIISAPVDLLVYDYTYWDDMVSFINSPDEKWKEWPAENLGTLIPSYSVTQVWVFGTDKKLFYQIGDSNFRNSFSQIIPIGALDSLYKNRFIKFFINTPYGLMYISGASVHPSNDPDHKTPPLGYFLLGNLWDYSIISNFENLTGCSVKITTPDTANLPTTTGSVTINKPLKSFDGKIISTIQFYKPNPFLASIKTLSNYTLLFYTLTVIIIILSFFIAFQQIVIKPLSHISQSLKTGNISSLRKYFGQHNEFGEIAEMIDCFYKQKDILAENEQKLLSIFNLSPVNIIYTRLSDGVILDLNDTFCAFLGEDKINVIGKSTTEIGVWKDLNRRALFAEHLQQFGNIDNFDLDLKSASGELLPHLVSARLVEIKGQKCILSIVRDISQIKYAEAALKEAQKISDIGNFTYEMGTGSMTWSEHLFHLFNLVPASAAPELDEVLRLFDPEELSRLMKSMNKLIKKGSSLEIEYKISLPGSDSPVYHFVKANPVINEDNQIIKIFGTVQNITKSKMIELRLRESEQQLMDANIMKDKIFSILHHDFMSPLKAATLILDSLEADPELVDEKEQRQIMQVIKDSNKSIYRLIENLLEWARSTKSDIVFNPKTHNVKEIVDECITFHSLNAKNKNINLHSLINSPVKSFFDKNMITTVIRNLISNAIKYTPNKGEITISAQKQDGYITVSVTDTGIGISKSNQKKLFQIDQSFTTKGTRNEEGTGLGLILCNNFVKTNKGLLTVNSHEGHGTTFSFTLPVENHT